jgi:hypothetical protein
MANASEKLLCLHQSQPQRRGTSVAVMLDFTFKNAWLARAAQGLERQDIVDIAMAHHLAIQER